MEDFTEQCPHTLDGQFMVFKINLSEVETQTRHFVQLKRIT